MINRLPGGGDIGRIFDQIGAQAQSAKKDAANFFKAQRGDSAPVPRLLSSIREAKVNLTTFDSFRASMHLDSASLRELKKHAGELSTIVRSALDSAKDEIVARMNCSDQQLKVRDHIKSNKQLFTEGRTSALLDLNQKLREAQKSDSVNRPPLLRFTPMKEPNIFQVHYFNEELELETRDITIEKNGKLKMEGMEYNLLEDINYTLQDRMPTMQQIKAHPPL